MTRIITNKLIAVVVEVTNLGELFPKSVLKGQIGLDIRVEQGSLSTGNSADAIDFIHQLATRTGCDVLYDGMINSSPDELTFVWDKRDRKVV